MRDDQGLMAMMLLTVRDGATDVDVARRTMFLTGRDGWLSRG